MAVNILNNIEHNSETENKSELCATTPQSFIERYCSKLNISTPKLTFLSTFVAKKIQKENLINDNTPQVVVIRFVYFISMICRLNISDINNICGVSKVTMNKCYKKMDVMKESLIPNCILVKYS